MNAKEQMENKIMTEGRMFELTRKYLRNMEIRHWCFLCFGAFEKFADKSNVILSPLWTSESVVRRVMMRIVKFSCGSKDSDGAFAFSAQPLRMTGNKGLVNVVICNGGVRC